MKAHYYLASTVLMIAGCQSVVTRPEVGWHPTCHVLMIEFIDCIEEPDNPFCTVSCFSGDDEEDYCWSACGIDEESGEIVLCLSTDMTSGVRIVSENHLVIQSPLAERSASSYVSGKRSASYAAHQEIPNALTRSYTSVIPCEWTSWGGIPVYLPKERFSWPFPADTTEEEIIEELFADMPLNQPGIVEPLQFKLNFSGAGVTSIDLVLPWHTSEWGDPEEFDSSTELMCGERLELLSEPKDLSSPASVSLLHVAGMTEEVLRWLSERTSPTHLTGVVGGASVPGQGILDVYFSAEFADNSVAVSLTEAFLVEGPLGELTWMPGDELVFPVQVIEF